ncbi:MAG: hypothetical protein QM689_04020 [Oscillospiraceae bacterium]
MIGRRMRALLLRGRTSAAMTADDLPGFHKKSFSLAFGGGEIWCAHIDGLYGFTEPAAEKFSAEIKAVLRPSATSLVIVVMNETIPAQPLLERIAKTFAENPRFVKRAAFVGLDAGARARLKHLLRKHGALCACAYFSDLEKAKHWIAGEEY